MKGFKIMPMRHEDLSEVIYADNMIFGHTLSFETLKNELDINPFAHYFVMRDTATGNLSGHVSVWIDSPNAQILNLYILPEYQGKKLGDDLIAFCINYLDKFHVENITLEVRPSNFKAIQLYEKYGFHKATIRKNYYDNGEDALLMLKKCEVMDK